MKQVTYVKVIFSHFLRNAGYHIPKIILYKIILPGTRTTGSHEKGTMLPAFSLRNHSGLDT